VFDASIGIEESEGAVGVCDSPHAAERKMSSADTTRTVIRSAARLMFIFMSGAPALSSEFGAYAVEVIRP